MVGDEPNAPFVGNRLLISVSSFWSQARPTLALALPIIAGQVAQMAMGLVDSAMVGQVGVIPLAAAAFANTLISVPLVFGIGLMLALSIRISQVRGTQNDDGADTKIAELLRHGIVLALVAGITLALSLWIGSHYLDKFGQNADVALESRVFLLWVGASIPFVLLMFGLKNFCEALDNPWAPTLILSASVPLNIVFNWVLIYGNLGAPALGLAGAGIATLLARVLSCVALWIYVTRAPRFAARMPVRWLAPLDWERLNVLLRLGVPTALQIVLEVGAFSAAALMVGWIGPKPLAAHQIVLACAGTTFMIPLGISFAASIRAGTMAHQPGRARALGNNALTLALISAGTSATFYLIFRTAIARAFVDDSVVAGIATQLFLVVAIFQVVDGIQVMAAGLLRGLSDATAPMLISLGCYWGIGLPLGYIAGFRLGLGALGVWIGLAVALACAACALVLRFRNRTAGDGENRRVEEVPVDALSY